MSPDFIYTMKDLRKVVPPKREILKGIWLSFYDGAKIGVLGLNGAGKSSLLRIMAGMDQDFIGEAFLGKGYTVGFLSEEPTNHLDAESVAWLEHFLKEYPGTVVAVTHDRYFLDNVAGWILELDRGAGIPWKGNYSSWLEQKQARLSLEEKTESARQRTLKRELEWIRMSPRARQAKSQARVTAYEELLRVENEKREVIAEISIPPGPRLGNLVV